MPVFLRAILQFPEQLDPVVRAELEQLVAGLQSWAKKAIKPGNGGLGIDASEVQDGEIPIGNARLGQFDLNRIAEGGGINVESGEGTISIAIKDTIDFLTASDQAAELPASRQLIAGSGVSFDDTTPNERTVNVTGGVSGGSYSLCQGRLTTESGVPVSTSDRTAQGTIYFTPYKGNQIGLYDGATWQMVTFAELSLALSALTSGKNYDVFVDYNGGTPQLVLVAWTNDTTRATALTLQDGVEVLTGNLDHRYVGTLRTTSTTTTEDSATKRFVWNAYNQVPRHLSKSDGTGHTYATNTTRYWNNDGTNIVEAVFGAAQTVEAAIRGNMTAGTDGRNTVTGIGLDSGTTESQSVQSAVAQQVAFGFAFPLQIGLGYHFISALERAASSASVTFNSYNLYALLLN
jgi:hypothetical protein